MKNIVKFMLTITKVYFRNEKKGIIYDNQSQMRKREFFNLEKVRWTACKWLKISMAKSNFNAFTQCDSRCVVSKSIIFCIAVMSTIVNSR